MAVNRSASKAKKRALEAGIPYSLASRALIAIWEKQGGKCALSGIEFRRTTVAGCASTFSPSIDRVIPALGYVEGNTRLILNGLNSLKLTATDVEVLEICSAVVAAKGED